MHVSKGVRSIVGKEVHGGGGGRGLETPLILQDSGK